MACGCDQLTRKGTKLIPSPTLGIQSHTPRAEAISRVQTAWLGLGVLVQKRSVLDYAAFSRPSTLDQGQKHPNPLAARTPQADEPSLPSKHEGWRNTNYFQTKLNE